MTLDPIAQRDANLADPDGPPTPATAPTKFRVVAQITVLQPLRAQIDAPEGMGQAQEILDENADYDMQALKYCRWVRGHLPGAEKVDYQLCLEPVE